MESLNSVGDTPLIVAVLQNDVISAKLLLSFGADVNK